MSAVIESIPNPLHSTFIPPKVLSDNADKRIRDSTTSPFAFITTKQHATLPLSIHNYTYRSFGASSPLTSYSLEQREQIIDSQGVLSSRNEESLALTLASRSLVTERSTGRVISRSFTKFFNYYEKMAYIPTGDEYAYEIEEKVDGSIISLFWYDEFPNTSGTFQSRGQWIVASRSSFASPHTESGWNILNTRFSSLVNDTQDSSLDKSKTYVFELVDNRMPIKIRYPYDSDLVLLSIIGTDGCEERLANTRLPFRRPRMWRLEELLAGETLGIGVTTSNLKQLSKLDRANEEGFVITFWRTKEDVHPQRVKVKLECYLKLCKSEPGNCSSRLSQPSRSNTISTPLIDSLPSPKSLLQIYVSRRMSNPSFIGIDDYMSSLKRQLLEDIRGLNISDDYGGEAWFDQIMKIWDRIHAFCSNQERNWMKTVLQLEKEGFRSRLQRQTFTTLDWKFENRIGSTDVDQSLKSSLRAWFEGQSSQEILKLVVESVEFPKDLNSTEIIVLDE